MNTHELAKELENIFDSHVDNETKWLAVAEFAFSKVYQTEIESILDRALLHTRCAAFIAKLDAARRAGVADRIGEIFCRDYDSFMS